MLDDTYEHIETAATGGHVGLDRADFHDTTITDRGTMLLISYYPTPKYLSAVGGPEDGWVLDGCIQEIDIDTGEVVFEWSAADHVSAEHTFQEIAPDDDAMGAEDAPFDWFHLNSVTEDDDDSLIPSARNNYAIYKLDMQTDEPVQTVERDGFEVEIPLEPGVPYVTVEALDDNGQVLATCTPQD